MIVKQSLTPVSRLILRKHMIHTGALLKSQKISIKKKTRINSRVYFRLIPIQYPFPQLGTVNARGKTGKNA